MFGFRIHVSVENQNQTSELEYIKKKKNTKKRSSLSIVDIKLEVCCDLQGIRSSDSCTVAHCDNGDSLHILLN